MESDNKGKFSKKNFWQIDNFRKNGNIKDFITEFFEMRIGQNCLKTYIFSQLYVETNTLFLGGHINECSKLLDQSPGSS